MTPHRKDHLMGTCAYLHPDCLDASEPRKPCRCAEMRPVSLVLTEDEARTLAITARSEAAREDDFRYQLPDPKESAERQKRWRRIADAFDTDPYRKRV